MRKESKQLNDLVVDVFFPDHDAPENLFAPDTTAVFVHGAGGGSWYWENWMTWLCAKGVTCQAINLRGHHPSKPVEKIGRVSILEYVSDVESLLNSIEGDIILIGHSMGALISQQIVASQKYSVIALVVMGSAPPDGVKMQGPKEEGIGYRIKSGLMAIGMIYKMIVKTPLVPVFRATRHYVANCIPESEQRDFHNKLVPESAQVSLDVTKGVIKAQLARIDIPKLLIAGEQDMMAVLPMQREIAEMQQMEFKHYPDHAHMLMIEPGWQQVLEDVYQWFQSSSLSQSRISREISAGTSA